MKKRKAYGLVAHSLPQLPTLQHAQTSEGSSAVHDGRRTMLRHSQSKELAPAQSSTDSMGGDPYSTSKPGATSYH